MEGVTRSLRMNPTNDRLLDKYIKEHPELFETKSDLIRDLINEFLEKQGLM